MASTIAAITTGAGGIVQTADASGNLSLLSGDTTVVAVTATGATVTGALGVTGVATLAAGAILGTPASGNLANCTGFPAVTMPAGSVLQAAFISQDTMISTSVTMNYSSSLPTITQGAQILSRSFTPIKASSTLFFFFNTYGTSSNTSNVIYALFEDSTCISAIAPRFVTAGESGWATVISRSKAAVSTTARTYSVRFGGQPGNAPTCAVNSYPLFAGAPQTTIMILEIAA